MGWLEKSDIKLISTQVVVEVEVELGKNQNCKYGEFCWFLHKHEEYIKSHDGNDQELADKNL